MNAEREIAEAFPSLLLRRDVMYSRRTTVGIGGRAALAAFPQSAEELCEVVLYLQKRSLKFAVIGAGANILVADSGFGGVSVFTDRVDFIRAEGDRILCGSGCRAGRLIKVARESGVGGFSFLEGIPASVGGAVYMNAGAGGMYIGERVRCVTAAEEGVLKHFKREECGFSYKNSRFQHTNAVILSLELQGEYCSGEEIVRECTAVRERRAALPKGRSMGCIFKNPPGRSAGELIEICGLKGKRCGGAVVSSVHANFIINESDASAEDFRRLISLIKREVLYKTGVLLEEEIRYIGDFYASYG